MKLKRGVKARALRPVLIVSMSSPGYSSARLRPRRAGLHFTRYAHLTNGPIQFRSSSRSDTTFLLLPLLANIYLHYAFDLWVQQWRTKQAHGDVLVVRFADDFVVGFQHRKEAERFQEELGERLAKFGLKLHPEKTRLIEFGRFAMQNQKTRGQGKPETFNFLGFTHCCGQTRKGKFTVIRKTMRQRMLTKLKAVSEELRRRRHDPIPDQGRYVHAVVQGHVHYFGVPLNSPAIQAFRYQVICRWRQWLNRRSQRASVTWARMKRYTALWVPPAIIVHPYPAARFGG